MFVGYYEDTVKNIIRVDAYLALEHDQSLSSIACNAAYHMNSSLPGVRSGSHVSLYSVICAVTCC